MPATAKAPRARARWRPRRRNRPSKPDPRPSRTLLDRRDTAPPGRPSRHRQPSRSSARAGRAGGRGAPARATATGFSRTFSPKRSRIDRPQIAEAVDEAEARAPRPRPRRAPEKSASAVALEPPAPASLDERHEHRRGSAPGCLEPLDVLRPLRAGTGRASPCWSRRCEGGARSPKRSMQRSKPNPAETTPIEPTSEDGSAKISSPAQASM